MPATPHHTTFATPSHLLCLILALRLCTSFRSVIIPRNSSIPTVKTQTYTTEENFQTAVDVCVYEGERLKTEGNNLLGKFTIKGIEKAKRGEPQIDVSFAIDSDGILTVSAKDQKTGAVAQIEIKNRSQMNKEQLDKLVAEAERFKKEDEERLKRVRAYSVRCVHLPFVWLIWVRFCVWRT
jgi:heat shock protein 1/8